MVCHLIRTRPLSVPMFISCQVNPRTHLSASKWKHFFNKMHLKVPSICSCLSSSIYRYNQFGLIKIQQFCIYLQPVIYISMITSWHGHTFRITSWHVFSISVPLWWESTSDAHKCGSRHPKSYFFFSTVYYHPIESDTEPGFMKSDSCPTSYRTI